MNLAYASPVSTITPVHPIGPIDPALLEGTIRVLVAEDDPVQGMLLMLFLERIGVSAALVTDGAQAVEAVKTGDFSLVLMDYLMPSTNGVEATHCIRAWEKANGRTPLSIVAVTASAMKDDCRRYVDAGMDSVLVKPFSARELGELVMRYLPVAQFGEALATSS